MKNCVQATSTIGWQMERDVLRRILLEMRFVIRCGTKTHLKVKIRTLEGTSEKSFGREISDSSTQIDWERWIIDAIDHFKISCKVFGGDTESRSANFRVAFGTEIVFHLASICQPWKLWQINYQIPARVMTLQRHLVPRQEWLHQTKSN